MKIAAWLAMGWLAVQAPFSYGASPDERQGSGAKSAYRVGDRLPQGKSKPSAAYKEIQWDELVPIDWDPMRFFDGIKLEQLEDGDPRATEALERLREEWDKAPVNASMNETRIRIPGFVVPLENQEQKLTEFLLVPYFGACIHVPPPPANQIIHVVVSKPAKGVRAMDAVWVSGLLETTRSNTGMGVAGYRMHGEVIVPYKE